MVGTSATLVLYFQDEKDPLCISDATVTWRDGESFGVRFPKLKGADRQRLQELVLRFATFRGTVRSIPPSGSCELNRPPP